MNLTIQLPNGEILTREYLVDSPEAAYEQARADLLLEAGIELEEPNPEAFVA